MRTILGLLLVVLGTLSLSAGEAGPVTAVEARRQLQMPLERLAALRAGSAHGEAQALADARAALAAWETAWSAVEHVVSASDRAAYAAIESAAADLRFQLDPRDGDPAAAATAIDQLVAAYRTWAAEGQAVASLQQPMTGHAAAGRPAAAQGGEPYAVLADQAAQALRALRAGELDSARAMIAAVRRGWPEVESRVSLRDQGAYHAIESLQARSAAFLSRGDRIQAEAALADLSARLDRFREARSVAWFDVWLILLREGLEALLVIAALIAWLRPAAAGDASAAARLARARRMVWLGAGAGLALSVVIAAVVNRLFRTAVSGAGRELIEGVVGIAAAVIMVWVAWWLHRQTAMAAWTGWLRERTRLLGAGGRVGAIALLAFLAVLREGAETALFLIALGPALPGRELAFGIGIGAATLAVIGTAVLGLGVRLPMVPLLRVLTVLLALLAVKFIGAGAGALQVAGVLAATPLAWWPDAPLLGFFASVEAVLAQAVMVAAMGMLVITSRRGQRPLEST